MGAKKKTSPAFRETDLYEPVREFLVAQGYTVRGEVIGCDIAATQNGELVVVELKRAITTGLLMQAAERQKLADAVYVAVSRPEKMGRGSRWKGLTHLVRRLELGLMVVSFTGGKPRVEVVFDPKPYRRPHNARKRRRVLVEMEGRSADHNVGGSNKRKLLTAYREQSLFIAHCLHRDGPLSPRELRALGAGPKTQPILYQNVYGWFEHIGRALYDVGPSGREALKSYPELTEHFEATRSENSAK